MNPESPNTHLTVLPMQPLFSQRPRSISSDLMPNICCSLSMYSLSQTRWPCPVPVFPSGGQGALRGRLCGGVQEGPERHPPAGHRLATPGLQTRGHGPVGAARHRGKEDLSDCVRLYQPCWVTSLLLVFEARSQTNGASSPLQCFVHPVKTILNAA